VSISQYYDYFLYHYCTAFYFDSICFSIFKYLERARKQDGKQAFSLLIFIALFIPAAQFADDILSLRLANGVRVCVNYPGSSISSKVGSESLQG
jgi:hypothetical protein